MEEPRDSIVEPSVTGVRRSSLYGREVELVILTRGAFLGIDRETQSG